MIKQDTDLTNRLYWQTSVLSPKKIHINRQNLQVVTMPRHVACHGKEIILTGLHSSRSVPRLLYLFLRLQLWVDSCWKSCLPCQICSTWCHPLHPYSLIVGLWDTSELSFLSNPLYLFSLSLPKCPSVSANGHQCPSPGHHVPL